MSFLSPTIRLPDQEGERLDSLNPSPIGYGTPINNVWGTKRITTKALDQLQIVETVHEEEVESGGKGGGDTSYTNTTYTYSATFAVLIDDKPIVGVRRVWMNGKLFFEDTPYQSGDILKANQTARSKMNIYYGTETQNPDPLLQAVRGSDCPAYRGRAYIVFNDIQLAEAGNRIPSVDVEVIEYGVGSNGDKPPYPYKVPLAHIVGDLCLRSGLKAHEFDVTQLTSTVVGFDVQGVVKASSVIEELMTLYHFYPVDDGEKLVFQQQPTPLFRQEHSENCLINEDGLVANAYHQVLGRQGYFPSEAGTTEGQFLLLRGALLMYRETGSLKAKQLVDELIKPLDRIYEQPVPSSTETLYLPHWLFVVKNAVISQSNTLNYRITLERKLGVYEAFIPPNYPGYGNLIKEITNAYPNDGSFASWENPYAGILGESYGKPLYWNSTDAGCVVQYPLAIGGGLSAPQTLEVNLMVIYNFGQYLELSQNMEAWPHWRAMEQTEISCAIDTLPWALECFELLHQVEGGTKWQRAIDATKATIDKTFDIDDGRQWFAETFGEPFVLPGVYLSTIRAGFGQSNIRRNTQDLAIDIDFNEGDGECQFGRGLDETIRATDTHIRIDYRGEFSGTGLSVASVPVPLANGEIISKEKISNLLWVFLEKADEGDGVLRRFFYPIRFAEQLNWTRDEVLDIPLSDFTFAQLTSDGWKVNAELPISSQRFLETGVEVTAVGVYYNGPGAGFCKLREMRPIPEVQLPFTPGTAPFTANAIQGSLIDWRGAPGIGYQDPLTWVLHDQPTKLENMLDFIEQSQLEYESRYGVRGPFMPCYVWDRFDKQEQEGVTPNTWTFQWVDPNTQWVGYTARVVAALAHAGHVADNSRARFYSLKFLEWLDQVWDDPNKFLPTNFEETLTPIQRSYPYTSGDLAVPYNGYIYEAVQFSTASTASTAPTFPTTLYETVQDGGVLWRCIGYTYGTLPVYGSYDEPHAAALFMRAAAFNWESNNFRPLMQRLIERLWSYLERLWDAAKGTDVENTWSHNPQNGEWFGFWSGEIMSTLSYMLNETDIARTFAGIFRNEIEDRLSKHTEWLLSKQRVIDVPKLEDTLVDSDYSVVRIKESELPRKVELTYYSPTRNGERDVRAIERRSARSEEIQTIETDLVLTGDEALRLVYISLTAQWVQRLEWEFESLDKRLQPGDVREYEADGVIHRMQFTEVNINPNGYAKVKALKYDPSVWTLSTLSSGDPLNTLGIEAPANTIPVFLDVPLLRESDDSRGAYTYPIPTKEKWNGASLFLSLIGNSYNTQVATYISRPTHGSVTAIPLVKKPTLIDYESEIVVSLTNGQLSSVTHEEFLNEQNLAIVGDELIAFKDAVLVGAGIYKLTTLMRGLRGSFKHIGSHGIGERFVYVGNSVKSMDLDSTFLDRSLFFKAVTTGQAVEDAPVNRATITSVRTKPIAPAHLRAVRFNNRIEVDWLPQSRYPSPLTDFRDGLYSEGNENYYLYMLDGPGGNKLEEVRLFNSRGFTINASTLFRLYGSLEAPVYISVEAESKFGTPGYTSEITV